MGRGCETDVEAAKSRLAKGYSRSAADYDALASHLYVKGIRRLLPRLRVPPMASILDVGSGTGVNLLEAARWFAPTAQLQGIDLSPGMVEVAKAKAHQMGIPAQFIVGDAERLPYPDASFDVVLCNSVLHWFNDRAAAVREMKRVLRPRGQVALICAAAPGFQEWFHLLDSLMRTFVPGAHESTLPDFPSAMEVAQLLRTSGFVIEHLNNPNYRETIQDHVGFVRLMSTVAPQWAAEMTDEAKRAIEQMAVSQMRVGWPRGFPNTYAAVEAIGTRFT
jgi:ubiquinone/menaquinone biosynthesis C-methylase UbiE